MRQKSLVQGLSTLAAASFFLIAIAKFLQPILPGATVWVMVWAGAESLVAFYGLRWALERSNTAFVSVFFGGMLVRLASLGVAAYVLSAFNIPPAAPLIALVMAYFTLSLIQFPFLKPDRPASFKRQPEERTAADQRSATLPSPDVLRTSVQNEVVG